MILYVDRTDRVTWLSSDNTPAMMLHGMYYTIPICIGHSSVNLLETNAYLYLQVTA